MKSVAATEIEYSGEEFLRQKFGTPDVPVQSSISNSLARYIESFDFFFIATSNKNGECDASFRGKGDGVPAIKVIDERTIIFPDYLGNGSFRSLGNILENPNIGMLFIDLRTGLRTRINGSAEVNQNPDWLEMFPGSIQVVKVTVREVYKQNRPVSMNQNTR